MMLPATPAAAHLLKVNDKDLKPLTADKKEIFVHLVMQGLYLRQRGRSDICSVISFLCGRLLNADWNDYKKLTRLIQYLHEIIYMALVQ